MEVQKILRELENKESRGNVLIQLISADNTFLTNHTFDLVPALLQTIDDAGDDRLDVIDLLDRLKVINTRDFLLLLQEHISLNSSCSLLLYKYIMEAMVQCLLRVENMRKRELQLESCVNSIITHVTARKKIEDDDDGESVMYREDQTTMMKLEGLQDFFRPLTKVLSSQLVSRELESALRNQRYTIIYVLLYLLEYCAKCQLHVEQFEAIAASFVDFLSCLHVSLDEILKVSNLPVERKSSKVREWSSYGVAIACHMVFSKNKSPHWFPIIITSKRRFILLIHSLTLLIQSESFSESSLSHLALLLSSIDQHSICEEDFQGTGSASCSLLIQNLCMVGLSSPKEQDRKGAWNLCVQNLVYLSTDSLVFKRLTTNNSLFPPLSLSNSRFDTLLICLSPSLRFSKMFDVLQSCPYPNVIAKLVDLTRRFTTACWPLSENEAIEKRNSFHSEKVIYSLAPHHHIVEIPSSLKLFHSSTGDSLHHLCSRKESQS
jgi:hypothetical protein